MEINNALALMTRAPQIDLTTPLLTAAKLRAADDQSALTALTMRERTDRQNALADYSQRFKAGDTNAAESLISHPDIYSQVVEIRGKLDDQRRKTYDDNIMRNAKGAQRVMMITDPAERQAAWNEEVTTARKEGRIDENTYKRLSGSPPNDLMLSNIVRTGLSLEQAITLEQKEKDRTMASRALQGVAAAYGAPANGNGNIDAPAQTGPRPGGPVSSSSTVIGDDEAERESLYEPGSGTRPKVGQIDTSRPIIKNLDGSFSTEKTITVGMDNKFVNIPTIVGGKQLTDEQAVAAYRAGTNKAVGEYATQEEAVAAAKARSAEIGRVRGARVAALDDDEMSPTGRKGETSAVPVASSPAAAARMPGIGNQNRSRIPLLIAAAGMPGVPAETRAVNLELLKHEIGRETGEMKDYGLYAAQELAAGRTPSTFESYQLRQKEAQRSQVNIDQRAEGAFANEFGKKQADRWNDYIKEADKSREKLVDIRNMRAISGRVGSQGTSAAIKETLGPYAEALGIDISNLSDIQAYSSVIERLAPQQRAPGSGATSDIEYQGFKKSLPTLIQNPNAREITLDTMEAMEMDRVERGEIAVKLATKELTRSQAEKMLRELPDPMSKFRQWKKDNPDQYRQAIKAGNEAATAKPASGGMSKADIDQSIANAKAAIARNPAARDAVIKRLQGAGIDTSGL